jgi:hypothetical protein
MVDSDASNLIENGVFFSAVIQGRYIAVTLPAQITPALSGLPAATPTFTGRDADLRDLLALLDPQSEANRVMISAVAGLAGVGKTELAVQAARRALGRGWFPGGVLFVDLYGYDEDRCIDAERALDGLLRALGIPAEHIPNGTQDRARLFASALAAFADQHRRLLVLIDNVSSADQARPLLPTDGVTSAIVTSRHTMGRLGARIMDLTVLSQDATVELLSWALQVARGSADTRVHDHPADARKIADLCGYLPLAAQIIAALLADDPGRPLSSMAADLANVHTRLSEMQYEDKAVHAAFDLSYRQLEPGQARLFRLITLDRGPEISTEAAAALVASDQRSARRMLEALARAHLVEHGSAYGRWRMHDLVRLYADEQGYVEAESDNRPSALGRLLDHYLTTARAATTHLDPAEANAASQRFPTRDKAMEWLDTELPNLIAIILAVSDHPVEVLELTFTITNFLNQEQRWDEQVAVAEAAVQAARQLGDLHEESKALETLFNTLTLLRRPEDAVTVGQRAATVYRELGRTNAESLILSLCGFVLSGLEQEAKALAATREAVAIYRHWLRTNPSDADLGLALVLFRFALVRVGHRVELIEALTAVQEAIGIFELSEVSIGARQLNSAYMTAVSALEDLGRSEESHVLRQKITYDEAEVVTLSGALNLEAIIRDSHEQTGSESRVLEAVWAAQIYALGGPAGQKSRNRGTEADLLHFTIDDEAGTEIVLLPVFTSFSRMQLGIIRNPFWSVQNVLQIDGAALLMNIDDEVQIVINPWTDLEFRLPSGAQIRRHIKAISAK